MGFVGHIAHGPDSKSFLVLFSKKNCFSGKRSRRLTKGLAICMDSHGDKGFHGIAIYRK